MSEFERFISLFEQEVLHTMDYLNMLDDAHWHAIPCDAETLYLGTRVNKITISALTRHLINAEKHWLENIDALPAGASMSLPGKATFLEGIADGPALIEAYRAGHETNMQQLRQLPAATLEKEIMFTGRRYTVMGFLWSILGHHAYHLGQMDLLMRQQGLLAPEYMEWPETARLLG